MPGYVPAQQAPAQRKTAEGGSAEHRTATYDRSAGDALGMSLNQTPRSQSLMQLRAALDGSPRVQALQGLTRALNRPREEDHDEPEQLQESRPAAMQFAAMPDDAGKPDDPPPVEKTPNATGLPDRLKAGVESLSGLALDDVRVHYNSQKPAAVHAHAYAQGTDIHLAPGQEQHLPHEAWHVVQQKQGRVKPTLQMKGVAIAVAQRMIKPFAGEQDKRIEVMLPDGTSHLEIDAGDTVADLREYFAKLRGWSAASILVSEYVGVDLPIDDIERLAPHLVYRVAPREERKNLKQPANAEKIGVAQKVSAALGIAGYDALLGGGGAASLYGSGRDIKDLDFKMGQALKAAYLADKEKVAQTILHALVAQNLNAQIQKAEAYVLRFIVIDRDVDSAPIEVSLTPVGKYNQALSRTDEVEHEGVAAVGPMELLLDKLFAFSERSIKDMAKLETDFVDIVTMIDLAPSLEDPSYLAERSTAYQKKFTREYKSSKNVDPKTVNAYTRLAPDIGLQVAMRTTVILHDSGLRESVGLRQLRIWIERVGRVVRTLQKLGGGGSRAPEAKSTIHEVKKEVQSTTPSLSLHTGSSGGQSDSDQQLLGEESKARVPSEDKKLRNEQLRKHQIDLAHALGGDKRETFLKRSNDEVLAKNDELTVAMSRLNEIFDDVAGNELMGV